MSKVYNSYQEAFFDFIASRGRHSGFYEPSQSFSEVWDDFMAELMMIGEMHGGFYEPQQIQIADRRNSVGEEEHGYFVYVWDEDQQKHVRRWVE